MTPTSQLSWRLNVLFQTFSKKTSWVLEIPPHTPVEGDGKSLSRQKQRCANCGCSVWKTWRSLALREKTGMNLKTPPSSNLTVTSKKQGTPMGKYDLWNLEKWRLESLQGLQIKQLSTSQEQRDLADPWRPFVSKSFFSLERLLGSHLNSVRDSMLKKHSEAFRVKHLQGLKVRPVALEFALLDIKCFGSFLKNTHFKGKHFNLISLSLARESAGLGGRSH